MVVNDNTMVIASSIYIPISLLIELPLLGHIDWMICYVSVSVCPLRPTSPLAFISFSPPLTDLQKQLADKFRPPSTGTLPLQIYVGFRDPFKLTEENDTVSDTIYVNITFQ